MRRRAMDIGCLLRIQAYRFCGVNAFIHGHDKRQRRHALWRLASGALISAMAVAYSAMLAVGLAEIGAAELIPRVFALAVFAMTLSVFMLKGPELVFGGRDVPMLRAMPVHTESIVISRLIGVLLPELGITLLIGISASIVWLLHGAMIGRALSFVLGLCWIPAIPAAVALLLGTIVARATLRMRHRPVVRAALMIVMIVGVVGLSGYLGFAAERGVLTESMLLALLGRYANVLAGVYPPADWLAQACQGDGLAWAWLVGTALLALGAMTACASWGFARVADGLAESTARGRIKEKPILPASPLRSLYRKEWLCYTGSTNYLMNTSVGWLLYLVMTVAVCMIDVEVYLPMLRAMPGVNVLAFLPLVPAMLAGMSSVTACAISMEGKQMEMMRAMPVRMQDWLGAKLLLHMTFAVPCVIGCGAVLAAKLHLSVTQAVLMVAYPLSGVSIVGMVGLAMNMRFPRFDWNQDVEVVKNGVSVLLTMLLGLLLPVAAAVGLWLSASTMALGVASVLQFAASGLLWRRLCRGKIP